MSFFTHPFYTTQGPSGDPSFTPLFRLLDDFDSYTREVAPTGRHAGRGRVRQFSPKFDIRETDQSFELHGELPGMSKDNILIDFTDPQTIVVKGKVERTYEAGSPPAGRLPSSSVSGAITEAGENGHKQARKTTVEDAAEEGEPAGKEVTPASGKEEAAPRDQARYWVSERSIGQFSRTFGLPSLVDQDAVTASLKDGILNISIPKAKKSTSRRITVQ